MFRNAQCRRVRPLLEKLTIRWVAEWLVYRHKFYSFFVDQIGVDDTALQNVWLGWGVNLVHTYFGSRAGLIRIGIRKKKIWFFVCLVCEPICNLGAAETLLSTSLGTLLCLHHKKTKRIYFGRSSWNIFSLPCKRMCVHIHILIIDD